MVKRTYCVFTVFLSLILFSGSTVSAQGFAGNSYYVYAFGLLKKSLTNYTFTFADNETSAGSDNGTESNSDNATRTGSVTISQAGKIFESSSGSYIATGNLYNGTWEATEKAYSSYYEENIYSYYSFQFFGTTLMEGFFTSGIIYSTLTTESASQGKNIETGIILFFGTLVNTSPAQTVHGYDN